MKVELLDYQSYEDNVTPVWSVKFYLRGVPARMQDNWGYVYTYGDRVADAYGAYSLAVCHLLDDLVKNQETGFLPGIGFSIKNLKTGAVVSNWNRIMAPIMYEHAQKLMKLALRKESKVPR